MQMRLTATDVVCSVDCVSVCLYVGQTSELCKAGEPIEMPFDNSLTWVQKTIIRWSTDPPQKGALLMGYVVTHCNVLMHKCIAPAAHYLTTPLSGTVCRP